MSADTDYIFERLTVNNLVFYPLDSFDDKWNQVLDKLTGWIPYQDIYDNYLELKNQESEEDE